MRSQQDLVHWGVVQEVDRPIDDLDHRELRSQHLLHQRAVGIHHDLRDPIAFHQRREHPLAERLVPEVAVVLAWQPFGSGRTLLVCCVVFRPEAKCQFMSAVKASHARQLQERAAECTA